MDWIEKKMYILLKYSRWKMQKIESSESFGGFVFFLQLYAH